MTIWKKPLAVLALGLAVTALASPSYAQRAGRDVSAARAAALHACSGFADSTGVMPIGPVWPTWPSRMTGKRIRELIANRRRRDDRFVAATFGRGCTLFAAWLHEWSHEKCGLPCKRGPLRSTGSFGHA